MNPEDLIARQAMMSRLIGNNPTPVLNQMSPDSGSQVPPPQPQVDPAQNNIGTQTRKASPHEKLIKSLLPATSNAYQPDVQGISKVLLTKLIPYL